jgi:SAM-dependent methyltransferase
MKSLLYELLYISSFILATIWITRHISKRFLTQPEGFQQKDRFVLKTDKSSYDGFYSEIYDEIWTPDERVNYEMEMIIQTIDPDTRFSNMLDVGCGTGTFLKELKQRGFKAQGIDRSKAMSQRCIDEGLQVTIGDILDPMVYDRSTFSHIFCLDFTLYELEDKRKFFKNAYYWLQNNGYLVIHLADKNQFNAIVPAARPIYLDSVEQLGPSRITKTEIEFDDFIYVSDYVTHNKKVIHKESFTDKATQHIRQNERTLEMDSTEEIMRMALAAGFSAKGAFSMEEGPSRDAAQDIIILER